MNRMAYLSQRGLEFAERRCVVLEFFVTERLQVRKHREASVEIFFSLEIKSLRGISKGLIEHFRRNLAVLDQFRPSFAILIGFCLVLETDLARILVGETGVYYAYQGCGSKSHIEHGAHPGERLGSELAIAIFDHRID